MSSFGSREAGGEDIRAAIDAIPRSLFFPAAYGDLEASTRKWKQMSLDLSLRRDNADSGSSNSVKAVERDIEQLLPALPGDSGPDSRDGLAVAAAAPLPEEKAAAEAQDSRDADLQKVIEWMHAFRMRGFPSLAPVCFRADRDLPYVLTAIEQFERAGDFLVLSDAQAAAEEEAARQQNSRVAGLPPQAAASSAAASLADRRSASEPLPEESQRLALELQSEGSSFMNAVASSIALSQQRPSPQLQLLLSVFLQKHVLADLEHRLMDLDGPALPLPATLLPPIVFEKETDADAQWAHPYMPVGRL